MKQQAPPSRSAFYVGAVPTAWRLLGRRSRDIKLAISLRFLQAMLAGAPVIFLVWVVDHLRRGTLAPSHAWIATAGALVAVLAQGWVWYASNRFAWINGFLAVGEARASTLNHVQRLPLGTLRSRSTGDVTATFSTDFETVSQYITEALPALFGAIGLPVIVVAGLFFVDLALAGAVAISLLVAGPIFFWVNKRFKALALLRGNLMAESSGRMLEYVLGITVARAFNRTDDGDRVWWSQLTWISGATARLLSWWILSYSIGERISRAVWRRCRLWKISRYSKIALANSMRVRHRRRLRSSTCIRAQNDSINALSKQSPTDPIEGTRPDWRARSVNAQDVKGVPWSE